MRCGQAELFNSVDWMVSYSEEFKMPANAMLPKIVSAVTHIAGILGSIGLLVKVLVTARLALRHKSVESD